MVDTNFSSGEPNSAGATEKMFSDFHRNKEEAEKARIHNHPVEINGKKLKIGDLYPEHYAAKEFHGKLKLLEKGAQGGKDMKAGGLGEEPEEEEEDDEDLEDSLFGKGGSDKSTKGKSTKETE